MYDSPIYIIDDFYRDPDSIVRYLMSQDAPLWKMEEEFQPSHNGIYFEDRKHQIESSEIAPAYYFLQSICKQKIDCLGDIDTNVTRFKSTSLMIINIITGIHIPMMDTLRLFI